MRLLVLADKEPSWTCLGDAIEAKRADAVVTAGDLREWWLKESGIQDTETPTYGVYGNHCNGRYLNSLGITNLHLNRVEFGGVSFVGLEGCVRYKKQGRDILYTQDEYAAMIADLPAADVLVTHCPPAGINDHVDPAHVGIDALRQWIDTHKPAVLIHGHTYPDSPVRSHGSTRVEYVFGARVVTV